MEHIGVLIDYDVLIENLRGNQGATAKISAREEDGEALYTTTVNSFELYYGAYKSKKVEKNIKAVDELLKRLMLLPLDGASSKAAARILKGMYAKGEPIEFRDALIAGITTVNKVRLFTNNRRHFKGTGVAMF